MTVCAITCPECGHRIEPRRKEVLRVARLVLRVDTNLVHIGDKKPFRIPKKQMAMLVELVRNLDQVCSKDHLLTIIDDWGDLDQHTLSVYIFRIRKYIAGSGVNIATIHGIGYMATTRDVTPMQVRPRITSEQAVRVVDMVRSGQSLGEAARTVDVAHKTARNAAIRGGVWPRQQL